MTCKCLISSSQIKPGDKLNFSSKKFLLSQLSSYFSISKMPFRVSKDVGGIVSVVNGPRCVRCVSVHVKQDADFCLPFHGVVLNSAHLSTRLLCQSRSLAHVCVFVTQRDELWNERLKQRERDVRSCVRQKERRREWFAHHPADLLLSKNSRSNALSF